MNVSKAIGVYLGPSYAGDLTIGYAVKQPNGTVVIARTTAGVSESAAGEFRATASVDQGLGELWVEWYQGATRIPGAVQLIDTRLFALSAAVQGLPASIVGSVVNAGPVEIGDAITATVNESFGRTLAVIGLDSTGWTAFAFIVKESPDDDDDQALICVRVSNPGAVDDGLLTLNGKAADDATLATLTVDSASPDTSVSVSIDTAGMAIRASEGRSYTWGLVRWIGDDKATIGRGNFNASAAIVQATEAP